MAGSPGLAPSSAAMRRSRTTYSKRCLLTLIAASAEISRMRMMIALATSQKVQRRDVSIVLWRKADGDQAL